MNVWDFVLAILILLTVIIAVVKSVRLWRSGGCSCGGGDCEACRKRVKSRDTHL